MNAELANRLLDYAHAQRGYLIDLLGELVDAESPSSRPDSHRRIRAALTAELMSLGLKVVPLRGGDAAWHIYARPVERSRRTSAQLLIGHYDTVWPLGTVTDRPLEVDGNVIRGPGVFDMKGGIVQMIIALKALQNLRLKPPLLPVVFLNSDEEIGSRTSTRYIRALARRVSRALVLEPAMGEDGAIKTERKGIGRFTVTVHGKAAHAGLDPEAGASAILELSHVIQTLFALNDPDEGITVNVGTIDGGVQPNVIAPYSQAVVDVRVPTLAAGKRIEETIHRIEPATPGVRLTIEGRIGRPSMEATPRNRILWLKAHQLGRLIGLELRQGRAGGGSDGNTTSQYTATLDGLGPVGDGAHAEHEFLYIDKTLDRTALLAMLLLSPDVRS